MAAASSSSRCILGLRRSTLHAAARRSAQSQQRLQNRSLHSLPALPGSLKEGEGCSPLFSPTAVQLLWKDWHGGLLHKLNDEVRGTEWENSSIAETVVGTARDPHHIQAFNYSSLALNNAFFLSNLKEKILPANATQWWDVSPPKPVGRLMDAIEVNFESFPAFKLAFSSMAYGMSGSGYVWLVRDRGGHLGVVPTYGAGTILVQNRMQRDGARSEWLQASITDRPSSPAATPSAASSGQGSSSTNRSSLSPSARLQQNLPRAMSTSARTSFAASSSLLASNSSSANLERIESRGEELYPLLCVSVHERDWLPDYGMWGKEEYLMRFWECVDWDRVNRLWETYIMST